MSRTVALVASTGFTLFTLLVIGLFLFLGPSLFPQASTGSEEAEIAQVEAENQAVQAMPDLSPNLATRDLIALAEARTQYQARLQELDRLQEERQAEYEARLGELVTSSAAADSQIAEVEHATRSYQQQTAQLWNALDEYNAVLEAQFQAFEAERSTRLEQLQAQLAEGQANLAAAQAQLGQ